MRVIIQRVSTASVVINGDLRREIGKGMMILLGIEDEDNQGDIDWLCRKIVNLRIFDDEQGVMNLSIEDVGGEILLISQFTLHASTKKGNRPTYIRASKPDVAIPLYTAFEKTLEQEFKQSIKTGEFGADMQVSLVNEGPVTIFIDSKRKE